MHMTPDITTAVLSIGRLPNDAYRTPATHPGRLTHYGVTDALLRLLPSELTVLAITDGAGYYAGETEPCTTIMVTGPTREVDEYAEIMADHARRRWAQECIGYVRMLTPDWTASTQWPTGDAAPHVER